MEMGIMWQDWIRQSPHDRALYIAVKQARQKMDAVEDGDRALKERTAERHQRGKR